MIHHSMNHLTQSVANELSMALEKCETELCSVAFSGGSTPKAIFRGLAKDYLHSIDWKRFAFFWVDERCVPHTSPESNYGEAKRLLLDTVSAHTFPIHGEADPEREAERYSKLMRSKLATAKGFPILNLIFLGIGTDGHTASIFPNSMHLLKHPKPCAHAIQPQSGQHRVTMTGGTLLSAKRVVFLATGSDKQPILREVIGQSGQYLNYPAWHIASSHTDCQWFLDEEAGRYTELKLDD